MIIKSIMDKIVSIIPVHEYNEEVKKLLTLAIQSVPSNVDICISCPSKIKEELEKDHKVKKYVTTEDGSSFQELVNHSVKKLKDEYKWFSILEYDDTYTPYWFDEVEKYYLTYPDVSIFLPLTDLMRMNGDSLSFFGYGNEAPWASAFSNEIGFIDFDVLSTYFDFYLTGSVINTNDFLSVGGLKESMKLVFWYEFLLRLTNKEKKVFVIPKVGYKHIVGRENSLFDMYNSTMTPDETQWWYELAKQECYFENDRKKTYETREVEEEE